MSCLETDDPGDRQPTCHRTAPILKIIDYGAARYEDTPERAQQCNLHDIAYLIQQLATLNHEDQFFPPIFTLRGHFGLNNFRTETSQEFIRSPLYSDDLKRLVCACMAESIGMRPLLLPVLHECQRNVDLIGNWRRLADEISELFDDAPILDDDPMDLDYEP
ncbi:hypothetical protein F5B22DRAFT_451402 [Xylaria bambusicola]|uniref:uncharacterized protein n=1 Tax=Xylaria bambusicola TaxID=326684 RepID=UPI002007B859|nr:uncharacterized protein F5B22DRAFT_451402 [Xylaria bambusicola]KAI0506374.1 hypothetical protein F5B22DRAFT_451402 [Xylaria bambusicola]